MATVALASLGTRGDLFPMLGLAQELARHGHRATVFALDEYRADVESAGVRFVRSHRGRPFQNVLKRPDGGARMISKLMREVALPHVAESVEAMVTTADQPDVVIASEFEYAGPLAAELLGAPLISVISGEVANLFHLPPHATAAERAQHRNVLSLLDRIGGATLNGARRSFGLPARADVATFGSLSSRAVLVMDSQIFVPSWQHWPSHFRLAGYPTYHGGGSPDLPGEVRAFVQREDLGPLIVCTLGDSWEGDYPEPARHLAEVARRRHLRVLYLVCRASAVPDTGRCLTYPFVPLASVLDRSSLVVHHAGRGTLMTTLRSRTPSLMLPHWLDGFANARAAVGLGVGRLLREDMSVDDVEREVAEALDGGHYRHRTEQVAGLVASEPDPGLVAVASVRRLTGAPDATVGATCGS